MSNDDTNTNEETGAADDSRYGAGGYASRSSWQSSAATEDMSVIGPSLVIKGELEAGEDLLIEGRVEGTIKHTADKLLIGQRGKVKADVRARNVVVEDFGHYLEHPGDIFFFAETGLASHGGFIGGLLAIVVFPSPRIALVNRIVRGASPAWESRMLVRMDR